MADLKTKIAGLTMKNPVMTASGTFGYGVEFADFVNLEDIGGIIVKGTTLHPREGNDYPRMVETASGMLNWWIICASISTPKSRTSAPT